MVRFAIIGIIVAVAFILFALVDAAMSDSRRARGVSKPVWVVLIVVLPVIGAALWFIIGKGRGPIPVPAAAPDDDPSFRAQNLSDAEIDAHMKELEARLRELDDEVFPEVDFPKGAESAKGTEGAENSKGSSGQHASDTADRGAKSSRGRAEAAETEGPRTGTDRASTDRTSTDRANTDSDGPGKATEPDSDSTAKRDGDSASDPR